jgi:hypothetical protein
MKNPFRRVPADDQLAAAEGAAREAEAQIERLTAQRVAKLAESEGTAYLKDIVAIDAEIERVRANAAVHVARIEAMKTKRQQQVRDQLEDEKRAGIAEARKLLSKRHEAGQKLD